MGENRLCLAFGCGVSCIRMRLMSVRGELVNKRERKKHNILSVPVRYLKTFFYWMTSSPTFFYH